jgi:hypothetical protein
MKKNPASLVFLLCSHRCDYRKRINTADENFIRYTLYECTIEKSTFNMLDFVVFFLLFHLFVLIKSIPINVTTQAIDRNILKKVLKNILLEKY